MRNLLYLKFSFPLIISVIFILQYAYGSFRHETKVHMYKSARYPRYYDLADNKTFLNPNKWMLESKTTFNESFNKKKKHKRKYRRGKRKHHHEADIEPLDRYRKKHYIMSWKTQHKTKNEEDAEKKDTVYDSSESIQDRFSFDNTRRNYLHINNAMEENTDDRGEDMQEDKGDRRSETALPKVFGEKENGMSFIQNANEKEIVYSNKPTSDDAPIEFFLTENNGQVKVTNLHNNNGEQNSKNVDQGRIPLQEQNIAENAKNLNNKEETILWDQSTKGGFARPPVLSNEKSEKDSPVKDSNGNHDYQKMKISAEYFNANRGDHSDAKGSFIATPTVPFYQQTVNNEEEPDRTFSRAKGVAEISAKINALSEFMDKLRESKLKKEPFQEVVKGYERDTSITDYGVNQQEALESHLGDDQLVSNEANIVRPIISDDHSKPQEVTDAWRQYENKNSYSQTVPYRMDIDLNSNNKENTKYMANFNSATQLSKAIIEGAKMMDQGGEQQQQGISSQNLIPEVFDAFSKTNNDLKERYLRLQNWVLERSEDATPEEVHKEVRNLNELADMVHLVNNLEKDMLKTILKRKRNIANPGYKHGNIPVKGENSGDKHFQNPNDVQDLLQYIYDRYIENRTAEEIPIVLQAFQKSVSDIVSKDGKIGSSESDDNDTLLYKSIDALNKKSHYLHIVNGSGNSDNDEYLYRDFSVRKDFLVEEDEGSGTEKTTNKSKAFENNMKKVMAQDEKLNHFLDRNNNQGPPVITVKLLKALDLFLDSVEIGRKIKKFRSKVEDMTESYNGSVYLTKNMRTSIGQLNKEINETLQKSELLNLGRNNDIDESNSTTEMNAHNFEIGDKNNEDVKLNSNKSSDSNIKNQKEHLKSNESLKKEHHDKEMKNGNFKSQLEDLLNTDTKSFRNSSNATFQEEPNINVTMLLNQAGSEIAEGRQEKNKKISNKNKSNKQIEVYEFRTPEESDYNQDASDHNSDNTQYVSKESTKGNESNSKVIMQSRLNQQQTPEMKLKNNNEFKSPGNPEAIINNDDIQNKYVSPEQKKTNSTANKASTENYYYTHELNSVDHFDNLSSTLIQHPKSAPSTTQGEVHTMVGAFNKGFKHIQNELLNNGIDDETLNYTNDALKEENEYISNLFYEENNGTVYGLDLPKNITNPSEKFPGTHSFNDKNIQQNQVISKWRKTSTDSNDNNISVLEKSKSEINLPEKINLIPNENSIDNINGMKKAINDRNFRPALNHIKSKSDQSDSYKGEKFDRKTVIMADEKDTSSGNVGQRRKMSAPNLQEDNSKGGNLQKPIDAFQHLDNFSEKEDKKEEFIKSNGYRNEVEAKLTDLERQISAIKNEKKTLDLLKEAARANSNEGSKEVNNFNNRDVETTRVLETFFPIKTKSEDEDLNVFSDDFYKKDVETKPGMQNKEDENVSDEIENARGLARNLNNMNFPDDLVENDEREYFPPPPIYIDDVSFKRSVIKSKKLNRIRIKHKNKGKKRTANINNHTRKITKSEKTISKKKTLTAIKANHKGLRRNRRQINSSNDNHFKKPISGTNKIADKIHSSYKQTMKRKTTKQARNTDLRKSKYYYQQRSSQVTKRLHKKNEGYSNNGSIKTSKRNFVFPNLLKKGDLQLIGKQLAKSIKRTEIETGKDIVIKDIIIKDSFLKKLTLDQQQFIWQILRSAYEQSHSKQPGKIIEETSTEEKVANEFLKSFFKNVTDNDSNLVKDISPTKDFSKKSNSSFEKQNTSVNANPIKELKNELSSAGINSISSILKTQKQSAFANITLVQDDKIQGKSIDEKENLVNIGEKKFFFKNSTGDSTKKDSRQRHLDSFFLQQKHSSSSYAKTPSKKHTTTEKDIKHNKTSNATSVKYTNDKNGTAVFLKAKNLNHTARYDNETSSKNQNHSSSNISTINNSSSNKTELDSIDKHEFKTKNTSEKEKVDDEADLLKSLPLDEAEKSVEQIMKLARQISKSYNFTNEKLVSDVARESKSEDKSKYTLNSTLSHGLNNTKNFTDSYNSSHQHEKINSSKAIESIAEKSTNSTNDIEGVEKINKTETIAQSHSIIDGRTNLTKNSNDSISRIYKSYNKFDITDLQIETQKNIKNKSNISDETMINSIDLLNGTNETRANPHAHTKSNCNNVPVTTDGDDVFRSRIDKCVSNNMTGFMDGLKNTSMIAKIENLNATEVYSKKNQSARTDEIDRLRNNTFNATSNETSNVTTSDNNLEHQQLLNKLCENERKRYPNRTIDCVDIVGFTLTNTSTQGKKLLIGDQNIQTLRNDSSIMKHENSSHLAEAGLSTGKPENNSQIYSQNSSLNESSKVIYKGKNLLMTLDSQGGEHIHIKGQNKTIEISYPPEKFKNKSITIRQGERIYQIPFQILTKWKENHFPESNNFVNLNKTSNMNKLVSNDTFVIKGTKISKEIYNDGAKTIIMERDSAKLSIYYPSKDEKAAGIKTGYMVLNENGKIYKIPLSYSQSNTNKTLKLNKKHPIEQEKQQKKTIWRNNSNNNGYQLETPQGRKFSNDKYHYKTHEMIDDLKSHLRHNERMTNNEQRGNTFSNIVHHKIHLHPSQKRHYPQIPGPIYNMKRFPIQTFSQNTIPKQSQHIEKIHHHRVDANNKENPEEFDSFVNQIMEESNPDYVQSDGTENYLSRGDSRNTELEQRDIERTSEKPYFDIGANRLEKTSADENFKRIPYHDDNDFYTLNKDIDNEKKNILSNDFGNVGIDVNGKKIGNIGLLSTAQEIPLKRKSTILKRRKQS